MPKRPAVLFKNALHRLMHLFNRFCLTAVQRFADHRLFCSSFPPEGALQSLIRPDPDVDFHISLPTRQYINECIQQLFERRILDDFLLDFNRFFNYFPDTLLPDPQAECSQSIRHGPIFEYTLSW